MLELLAINLAIVCGAFALLWCASLLLRDVSIIDLFWGLSFVLIAWATWYRTPSTSPLGWLLVGMVTVWGFRLSAYLTWRNWSRPEDHRYAAMRARHPRLFPFSSLATVFLLQAVLSWIVALPVQTGIWKGAEIGTFSIIGFVAWAIGVTFETVGDWQLARFKANPENKGKVMNRGLWRYTRHPNYFGDFAVWWGVYLVSLESGVVWSTLISPVLMSFLLMRVSGVTLLESSLDSRIDGYREYVETTSSFFPWFPRQLKSSRG